MSNRLETRTSPVSFFSIAGVTVITITKVQQIKLLLSVKKKKNIFWVCYVDSMIEKYAIISQQVQTSAHVLANDLSL